MDLSDLTLVSVVLASCGFFCNLLAFCFFSGLPKFRQKNGFLLLAIAEGLTCFFTGLNIYAIAVNYSLKGVFFCRGIWYMSYVVPTLGNWSFVYLSICHLIKIYKKKDIFLTWLGWITFLFILLFYSFIFFVVDITEDHNNIDDSNPKCYFVSEMSVLACTFLDFMFSTMATFLIIVMASFFIFKYIRKTRKIITYSSSLQQNELKQQINLSTFILVMNFFFVAINLIIFFGPLVYSEFGFEFYLSLVGRGLNSFFFLLYYKRIKKGCKPIEPLISI